MLSPWLSTPRAPQSSGFYVVATQSPPLPVYRPLVGWSVVFGRTQGRQRLVGRSGYSAQVKMMPPYRNSGLSTPSPRSRFDRRDRAARRPPLSPRPQQRSLSSLVHRQTRTPDLGHDSPQIEQTLRAALIEATRRALRHVCPSPSARARSIYALADAKHCQVQRDHVRRRVGRVRELLPVEG